MVCGVPASILYKSTAGRYRPVSYPDGPITARYRFMKNAYWGFTYIFVSSNDYGSLSHIQLLIGNRVATFLRKGCQLCLPSVSVSIVYNRAIVYNLGSCPRDYH